MWFVSRIAEADYGCEERMPGEPLRALVMLQSDDGRECRFEVAEDWLLRFVFTIRKEITEVFK